MLLKDIDKTDDKSLISFGEDFFEKSAKEKQKYERQWLLNLAFIAGDQLVHVNKETGQLDRLNTEYTPDWVIHIVNNRILPIYRNLTAKLTKSKPRPTATANSREESDIQAARAAVKLEENHWKTLKLDTIHPECVNWLIATGNCFYKQFWNDEKGEHVVDLSSMDEEAGVIEGTGKPSMTKEAVMAGEPVDFTLGDTDLILRTPFNIYPQPGKSVIRDMRIIGDADVMDIGEIKERYGKDVEPEKDSKLVRINQAVEGVIEQGGVDLQGGRHSEDDGSAVVKELYVLPCDKFPEGLKLVWANSILLDKVESCPDMPITHFGLIDIPGRFWYKGLIEDIIPIQRRWNELISKIEMHNDYYNDPPILYDPEAIDPDEITNEPGQLIPLKNANRPGKPLEVMEVPNLDQGIFKELEILDQQFEIVPAMHKVSFGKDSAHAKSGVAINFLQEKDEDIVRPLVDQIENGYAQVFRFDFKLCQENYSEDRGFAIVGEDNEVEWIEFQRANLDAEIDVGVEAGSAMPKSTAAKQAMVMDMLTAGFFTDPRTGQPDFAKALKYLEFGSVADIYEESALDSSQAKRENQRLKEGGEAIAEPWHNHEAHLYEHNRMRKTAEYEEMPDEIKQGYAAHIAHHEQIVAELQMQAQQQQMMAEGGQAPPPQAEAPPPEANEAEMTAAQADGILQELQASDPQAYEYIMSLPQEQQIAAIMEAMGQAGMV